MKYSVFSTGINDLENEMNTSNTNNNYDDNGSFLNSLFKNGFIVTPILIILNVLVFIAMTLDGMDVLDPSSDILVKWGANFSPYTLQGEAWRLITCCFIHIGIFHLLLNMFALFSIGFYIEQILGSFRYVLAYLAAGIGGSIISLWWHDITISAGASGAIFGMYGFFLAYLVLNKVGIPERKDLLSSTTFFVGYNLLNGLRGGIDNAAHIGGLLSGAIIALGYYLILKNKKENRLKYLGIVIPSSAILIGGVLVYVSIPNSLSEFDSLLKQYAANEEKAMSIGSQLNSGNLAGIDKSLDEAIKLWQDNIKIIDKGIEMERLPEQYKNRLYSIKVYTELREEQYKLFKESLTSNDPAFQQRLDEMADKIDAKIEQLK